jgi:hypothetical protein
MMLRMHRFKSAALLGSVHLICIYTYVHTWAHIFVHGFSQLCESTCIHTYAHMYMVSTFVCADLLGVVFLLGSGPMQVVVGTWTGNSAGATCACRYVRFCDRVLYV